MLMIVYLTIGSEFVRTMWNLRVKLVIFLVVLLFPGHKGAAVDYKLNQVPVDYNQDNTKVETDSTDCVNLQLQRNHQQLSLLDASSNVVSVLLTFNDTVTNDVCKEVIAAYNLDRLSSGPSASTEYLFGKFRKCDSGTANANKCTYQCTCSEDPCQVITLAGTGTKAETESGIWPICLIEVEQ